MRLFGLFTWVGWNSFLAVIPIVLAYGITRLVQRPKPRHAWLRKLLIVLLGLGWLAFLPNTCYLLSEWRHFLPTGKFIDLYTSWRDAGSKMAILRLCVNTLFYFCYSTFGMLTFAMSIRPLVRLVKSKSNGLLVLGIPLFLLVSLGVYLGLMKRLNSWDLLTRPGLVWNKITALTHNSWDLGFIVAFAIFLWLAYLVTDIWIDGFVYRWKQIRKN